MHEAVGLHILLLRREALPQGNDLELGIMDVEMLLVSRGTVEISECKKCVGAAETLANNAELTALFGFHFRGPKIACYSKYCIRPRTRIPIPIQFYSCLPPNILFLCCI